MNILITGSSGFVGTHLTRFFLDAGHKVTGIDAVLHSEPTPFSNFHFIRADTTVPGEWQRAVKGQDVVINLTGKNIFRRWTEHYKRLIYDTRILTTRFVAEALDTGNKTLFISTSAVGYYGDRKDDLLDENASSGKDFLARVCVDWETEATKAAHKGGRVVITRFGVVLGKNGGALSAMIPAYRFFLGGPLGDGAQWFSWIHIQDLLEAMAFIIAHPDLEGPVNFCAPQPVRNNDLAKALARELNRPAVLRVPALIMRIAAGELGALALASQRAVPAKLLASGFQFRYPNIQSALTAVIH